jgi:hypothetical protein
MTKLTDHKTKKFLYLVVASIALATFAWSISGDGDVLRALKLAVALGVLPLVWVGLRYQRNEKKESGLSEDAFLLKQAGGITELLSQSITVRAIGWLCVAGPIILVLVILMGTKSFSLSVMAAVLSEIICIPCAVGCFRSAAKSRRAAEQAGAKTW